MKVTKKNFCPPPKVESSVVRIEPRHPLPNINFTEWDGLLRICFTRKNKTLGAIFKQKSILEMIFKNFKQSNSETANTSAKNVNQDVGMTIDVEAFAQEIKESDKDDKDDKDEDENMTGKEELIEFKNKIMTILTENKYNEQRATKMDIDNFLFLLNLFNNNGIHFK
jgi:18S rRNA (adenine1779-N6/adenine1780-N6)-dimethyltransferase